MKPITRRQFLGLSAAAGISLMTMGSRPLSELLEGIPPKEKLNLFKEIKLQAEQILSQYSAPGMSISAVYDNKPLYANGFGLMDIERHKPYTALTYQSICSMSKAFTSVALMQLVEAGKLDIEQPMVELVPYFQLKDPRYTAITIRHLLTHTSGLPTITDDDFLGEWDDPWVDDGTAKRYVESLAGMDFMLSSDPGDSNNFSYSDMGYDILATVIQEVSGQIFEYYCRDHILRPLGMVHSTFLKPEVPRGLLFTPYTRDEDGKPVVSPVFPYDRKHAPSSGLFTNAIDILPWMLMHLNQGKFMGRQILSPEYHAKLWQPLFNWDEQTGYGWGWVTFHNELGELVVTHGGAQPGINSNIAFLPSMKLGVSSMGNCLGSWSDVGYAGEFGWWLFDKLRAIMRPEAAAATRSVTGINFARKMLFRNIR